MNLSIYDFRDYKNYLEAYIKTQPSDGHGFRSKLASALRCNVAYVSQVLNKDAHLSLEQAEEVNLFLGHTESECEYFLLIVQFSRAGSHRLKTRMEASIKKVHQKRQILKNRVDITHSLSPTEQSVYYSAWYYAAIHILVTIPEFRTESAIVTRLGLPRQCVNSALSFLVTSGLLAKAGDNYEPGSSRVFLGTDSPFLNQHHINWRLKAASSFDRMSLLDLHFSGVVSLSREDVGVIKEGLITAINTARARIKDSKEEELQCLAVDFFGV